MATDSADTIFAPATPPGRSAIAVVRVSGAAAATVCQRLTNRPPPPSRVAAVRDLHDPRDRTLLDQAIVIWFPAPASATGEDVLELQVHGSRAVIGRMLRWLADLPGLRPAEAGEFTRRAFLGGRLDLTAVEGLADLLAAETEAQARQALRQLKGDLGRVYDGWRARILEALARVEAEIDFAAEEEVPEDLVATVRPEIEALSAEISVHLVNGGRGERVRAGVVVAVVGPPNAGKSSLVNLLARRDVAIVTEVPGTTRDVLEVHLDLGGYAVTMLDTAGLREAVGPIEAEGVRRARNRASSSDLKLVVVDGARWPTVDALTTGMIDRDSLVVVNKSDLGLPARLEVGGHAALPLSCHTGDGADALLGAVEDRVADLVGQVGEPVFNRVRHRAALETANAALRSFLEGPGEVELAIAAEDLRMAARALGRITGRVDVDDLLDRVFSEFCIGK